MSKSWLWVFGVWLISILIGGLWGLLSIQSFNTTLITQWLDKHSGSVQAVSAGLIVLLLILALVLLVIAYAIFSKKLRRASDAFASIAHDQAKFLRATQRAYISVEPDGILMVVGGAGVLGHVGVHNTGHLPAHNVRWFLDMKASPDRAEKEFAIGAFHGDAVVPPGVIMPRATSTKMLVAELNAQSGNPIRVRSEESPVFLYVWGWLPTKMDWAKTAGPVSAIVTIGLCEATEKLANTMSRENMLATTNMAMQPIKARR